MSDYIPHSDADFNNWQSNLITIVGENITLWGILADDYATLTAKQVIWTPAYAKANNRQNRTSADVRAKDDAREELKDEIRGFVQQWLANNSKVTDSDRERIGLHVKSTSRTPVPTPTTIPIGMVDFSVRLQHTISFADESTPRSKAKPEGVHGCEIWIKVDGDAPKDASEMTYLATATRTPYITTFEGSQVGKTIYYWLRWVNTRGKYGPWSHTVSAMIVG
jgi:hypothetical protein